MINPNDLTLPPSNTMLEKSILSLIIMDKDLLLTCELKRNDFYDNNYWLIYDFMKRNNTTDLQLICDSVAKNWIDMDYLFDISIYSMSISEFENYCKRIKEYSKQRQIIKKANTISAKAMSWNDVSSDITELIDINTEIVPVNKRSLLEVIIDDLDKLVKDDYICSFWYEYLDKSIWWMFAWNTVVIAWPTWSWKSSLAMNIIDKIINTHHVAIHSMEVGEVEITRLVTSLSTWYGVSRQRYLTNDEKMEVAEVMSLRNDDLKRLHIYTSWKFDKIVNQIRRDAIDWVRIHFIDHIGLIQTAGTNKTAQLEYITNTLKSLAQELQIFICELCQVSREWAKASRDFEKLQLHHLRQSGSIEQDANIVLLISRPDVDPQDKNPPKSDEMIINIAKNRYWPVGEGKAIFYKSTQIITWS